MKLKKLNIHNIASIEDANIDFTDDKLADQDLFLICGPTGAGKSTILDAICLALFETTPRIENSPKSDTINSYETQTDKKELNKVKSVLHLIRRNAVEASVSLVFGVDGKDYTANWRAYRKGQYTTVKSKVKDAEGKDVKETREVSTFSKKSKEEQLETKLITEWTLTDPNGEVTDKKVKESIQDLIKMNFDQFCKTTMLAQGDFTKFLSSTADEKALILEKLVKTEQYSKVGKLINERTNKKKNELELLRRELESILFLSPEQRQEKEQKIKALELEISKIDKEDKDIQGKLQWIKDIEKANKDEEESAAALAKAKEISESDESKQLRQTIMLWDSTTALRNALSTEIRCHREAIKNEEQKVQLTERYDDAVAAKAFIITESDDLLSATEKIKEEILPLSRFEPMFESVGTICKCQNTIIRERKYIEVNSPKIDECENRLMPILKEENDLKEEKETKAAEISKLEETIAEKERQLSDNGADSILADIDRLNAHKTSVTGAESAHTRLQEAQEDHNTKLEVARQEANTLQQCRNTEQESKAALEKAVSVRDDSKTLYEKTKESVSDHAKVLRAQLKEGDNCPVCGNKVIALLNDEYFEQALKPLKDQLDKYENDVKILTERHNKDLSAMLASEKGKERADKDVKEAEKKLQTCKDTFTEACKSLGIKASENFTVEIERLKAEDESTAKAISLRQEVMKSVRKEIESINTTIANIRKIVNSIDIKLKKTEKTISEIKSQQSEIIGNIKKANETIEKELAEQSKLIDPQWYPQDKNQYFEELMAVSKRYVNAKNEIKTNETSIESKKKEIDHIADIQKSVLALFGQWEARTPKVPFKINDALKYWTDLQIHANNLHTEITNNAESLKNAQDIIADYTNSHEGADINSVKALLDISDTEIIRQKQIISDLDSSLSRLKGQHEAALKRKMELETSPLNEGETQETLTQAADSLSKARQEHAQNIGSIIKELNTDEENKKLKGKKKEELEALQEEFNEWDELNTYLGNTGGKNFRYVAQAFILSELLDNANAYLDNITGRYHLYCNPGSLTIMIEDAYQGGSVRTTNTLSGGESFIVSLALALGLSSMQNVDLEVDTLFIDEGFGSLSPEFIDPVINALKNLYKNYHRRVGIISHVETLKSRIPVTIEVTRKGSSRSEVNIVVN